MVHHNASCDEWQSEASCHGVVFENTLEHLISAPEFEDDGALDVVMDLSTMNAHNVTSPNFQQWGTIFPALDLMLDNWTINYYIAVSIKQTLSSTLILVQYANTMIGLMNMCSGHPWTTLIIRFFVYAAGIFFREYDLVFVKHVSSRVQRLGIVLYLTGEKVYSCKDVAANACMCQCR